MISLLSLLLIPILGSIVILFVSSPIYKTAEPGGRSEASLLFSSPTSPGDRENTALSMAESEYYQIIKNVTLENSKLKKIALFTSLINFFISILIWLQFDSSSLQFQFVYEGFLNPSYLSAANPEGELGFLHFNLGIDGISLYFVLLTTFITPVALLASNNEIDKNLKFYLVSILLLETLQIAVFVVLDFLLFYVFFESVLIPLFLIVGI